VSDTMLLAVLEMPPELWNDDPLFARQRYSRYQEAAERIRSDEEIIEALRREKAEATGHEVCEGMYADLCRDVEALCEALRAVLSLAGEDKQIQAIVDQAIQEHGQR